MSRRGIEDATIPVGGGFWRALGGNGALVVGYALIAVHVAVLVTDALVSPGLDYADRRRVGMLVLFSTALLPILAMCFVWIGELIRRGQWGGPSGHKPGAVLPQGSNTVRVQLLPLGWTLVWFVVALAASGVVLWAIGAATSRERFAIWSVNGIIAAAAAGAILGSGFKKWAWWRGGHVKAAGGPVAHPALARRKGGEARGRTFWRWFGYRWRLDLWLCVLGAVGLWFGGVTLAQRSAFENDAASMTALATWLVVVGGSLLVIGLWATTQFWRAGEDLAAGESVA